MQTGIRAELNLGGSRAAASSLLGPPRCAARCVGALPLPCGCLLLIAGLLLREVRSLRSNSVVFRMRLQSVMMCPALPQKTHVRCCRLLLNRPATIPRVGASPLSSLRRMAVRAATASASIGSRSRLPPPSSSPLSARALAVAFLGSFTCRNCTVVSSPTTSPCVPRPPVMLQQTGVPLEPVLQ